MPILRDEGPPVSNETLQQARDALPREYGYSIVNGNGRKVLLVRVPRAKPDYNFELADVALYVGLEELKEVRDVLLIGDDKTCRMEPVRLRDHIRDQVTEDSSMAEELLRRLSRDYGHTVVTSPINHNHNALAIRIPRGVVAEFNEDDVKRIREGMKVVLDKKLRECQSAYLIADTDFERLGRRVFLELVDPEAARAFSSAPSAASTAPLHLQHAVGGGTITPPLGVEPAQNEFRVVSPPVPAVPQVRPVAAPSYHRPGPTPLAAAPLRGSATPLVPASPAAAQAPPPAPARAYETTVDADEYAVIVSTPKPAPGARPSPLPAAAPPPAPPPARVQAPPAESVALPVERAYEAQTETDEYAVIVSKPKTPPSAPASPAPAPRIVPAPPVAAPPGPAQDNGAQLVPAVVPQRDAVEVLLERFQAAGYEAMLHVEALGHTFEFACHRPDGKRLLVKRAVRFDAKDPAALAKVVEDLGADACLVVAKEVAPGARMASWGTRVQVFTSEEATRATF